MSSPHRCGCRGSGTGSLGRNIPSTEIAKNGGRATNGLSCNRSLKDEKAIRQERSYDWPSSSNDEDEDFVPANLYRNTTNLVNLLATVGGCVRCFDACFS